MSASDKLVIINKYTSKISITSLPSGKMIASIDCNHHEVTIGGRHQTEDDCIAAAYQEIKKIITTEFFLISAFECFNDGSINE